MLLAYHDRSDGGLLVTLLEMAFAGGVGPRRRPRRRWPAIRRAALFTEELGAVLQVRAADVDARARGASPPTAWADASASLGRAARGRPRS